MMSISVTSYDNTRRLSATTWRHVTFVDHLRSLGVDNAYLYAVPPSPGATGGIASLNAFFLRLDRPEVYNLPNAPALPQRRTNKGLLTGMLTMAALGMAAVVSFAVGRKR